MLKDSKIMTPQERATAFEWIKKNCYYGIGVVHHRTIDERNIWQATLIAMKKALMHAVHDLPVRPSAIITDNMPLNLSDIHFHDIPVYYFPKGESKSSSIAAASIVAKVTRDAMMALYDQAIPGYTLTNNKGYGTAAHRDVLRQSAYSLIHRRTFVHTFLQKQDEQLTMFEVSHDETREIFCRSD
jgi:ribonuclease HII